MFDGRHDVIKTLSLEAFHEFVELVESLFFMTYVVCIELDRKMHHEWIVSAILGGFEGNMGNNQ